MLIDMTWMTRQEAATHLRCGVKNIDRLVSAGKLTRHYIAGDKSPPKFTTEELDQLLIPEDKDTNAAA